jgi:hypothetical protein
MKIFVGTVLHFTQLAMRLDISDASDRRTINKLKKLNPIVTLRHFITGVGTDDAGALVYKDQDNITAFVGKWEFDHIKKGRVVNEIYFKFTPQFEVDVHEVQNEDEILDEYYLLYKFKNNKKL